MIKTAIKAAKLAGEIMLKHYGKLNQVYQKENFKSIVTKADIECEKIIIKTIKEKYPNHNFIGEESTTKKTKTDSLFSWIIDPIDGTTNFAQNIPYFCVSIALVRENKPIIGVVYNPATKELFHAEENKGAFLNNKKITVSKRKKIEETMFVFSLSYDNKSSLKLLRKLTKIFPRIMGIRDMGSSALNLCYVACRRFDIYISYSIKPWDVSAGMLIVKEAGGKVTTKKGKEWLPKDESMIATNNLVHDEFLELVN